MTWIKCSERMPEHGVTVIICRRSGFGPKVESAWRDTNSFRSTSVWWDDGGYVTHWQQLPEPPSDA